MQEAEKQLKQLDADIEAEEARHRKLLQDQAAFNAGTDPLTRQIVDLESAALEKEPLPSLYQKARATPRPEDDVIVAQLQQLQQRQGQMEGEIQSVNNILQQRQQNLGELEEVRRRYRQNGYDSYNSNIPRQLFPGGAFGADAGRHDEFRHGLAGNRPPSAKHARTAEMQAGETAKAATSPGALVASAAAAISRPVAVFECP